MDIVKTDEYPFIIDYLSSGAEFIKGSSSSFIDAGDRGLNAGEVEVSLDALLAITLGARTTWGRFVRKWNLQKTICLHSWLFCFKDLFVFSS